MCIWEPRAERVPPLIELCTGGVCLLTVKVLLIGQKEVMLYYMLWYPAVLGCLSRMTWSVEIN